jgi:hypothetical protein
MQKAKSSPLHLEGFVVDSLIVKTNPDYDDKLDHAGSLRVAPDLLMHKTEEGRLLLRMRVRFDADPERPRALPYRVDVTGEAYFCVEPADTEGADGFRLVVYNGSAILFGLLRGQVMQATALGSHGTLILPVANLVDALRRKLSRKLKDMETGAAGRENQARPTDEK